MFETIYKMFTDGKRHLVCLPYSEDNLHKMAEDLKIARVWFHRGNFPHYDIPKKRVVEIEKLCTVVSSKDIVRICRGQYNDR